MTFSYVNVIFFRHLMAHESMNKIRKTGVYKNICSLASILLLLIIWIRSEVQGLDLSEHSETAYS